MGEPKPIDLDALMAEVRERIRIKREKGIYGPDVDALMRVPLPGGRRIFSTLFRNSRTTYDLASRRGSRHGS